jgi:hypothetical protein
MCNIIYLKERREVELMFNDGVVVETGGPLRKLHLEDGWYVVGEGFLIPVASEDEAERRIVEMTAGKQVCGHGED